MKAYPNSAALAKDMNLPPATLAATFAAYNALAAKGAPDQYGKKFYHNAPFTTNEELHVAWITPVVHYCMGGLAINAAAECITADNKAQYLPAALPLTCSAAARGKLSVWCASGSRALPAC